MRKQRPSVLLVDDDPSIRSFLTVLLERDGCRIDAASDGKQALIKLRKHRYSTVLLDLLMPQVNGFEVLQDLRALQPEILGNVIVLTAASDQTLADFADRKRIFRLLRKPLDDSEVLRAVRKCSARYAESHPPVRAVANH